MHAVEKNKMLVCIKHSDMCIFLNIKCNEKVLIVVANYCAVQEGGNPSSEHSLAELIKFFFSTFIFTDQAHGNFNCQN
jgi:hypothetical protein